MTPERRAEIEAWMADWDYAGPNPINMTIENTGRTIDMAAAVRELLAEIDRLKRQHLDIAGAVNQVQEFGGHDVVYIISEDDFHELQELRQRAYYNPTQPEDDE
jgi:hypothetical protein